MDCRCTEVESLRGLEAAKYAEHHLQEVRAEPKEWRIHYECPDTGIAWTLDYVSDSAYPGQRIVRLRSRSIPPPAAG